MPRKRPTSIARLLTLTSATLLVILASTPHNTFATASALPQPTAGLPSEALPATGTSNWDGLSHKSGAGGNSDSSNDPKPLSPSEDTSKDSSFVTKDDDGAKPFRLDTFADDSSSWTPKKHHAGSQTTPSSSKPTPKFKYNPPKDKPKPADFSTGMGSTTSDGLGATGGPDKKTPPASKPATDAASPATDAAPPAAAAGSPQSAQALLKSAFANIRAPKPAKKAAYALAFHGSASCGGTLLGVAINDEPTSRDGCATVVKADGVTVAKARSASVWTKGNGYKMQWYAEAGCKKPVMTSPEKSEGKFSRNGGACESPNSSRGFSYYKVVKSGVIEGG